MNWDVLNRLIGVHTATYRLTGGLVGHHIPFVPPMLLLDHVGAKSGRRRTSPLVYVKDGDNLALVASKGGHPRHPAWYHNLRANPDTTVQVGRRRMPVRARPAMPDERSRIWPRAVAVWRDYANYQRRTRRQIPIVILEPRG
jgi:deazaflavin-dependent oxidoreductase (nitroreductase family)